jgi:hypothetical protein
MSEGAGAGAGAAWAALNVPSAAAAPNKPAIFLSISKSSNRCCEQRIARSQQRNHQKMVPAARVMMSGRS